MTKITKLRTPIGNIITYKSPGGTETHQRTGLFGIFNFVHEIKKMQQEEKNKREKNCL